MIIAAALYIDNGQEAARDCLVLTRVYACCHDQIEFLKKNEAGFLHFNSC